MIPTVPLYIYCGGKCGSSTLYKSVVNKFGKNNVIKVHTKYQYNKDVTNKYCIFESIDLSCKTYDTVYIIDSYRTPVERKISSFFQNITLHVPDYMSKTVTELINIFNSVYVDTIEEYHSINEVLTHYNAPLFTEFDFKNKYNKLRHGNIVFIKIRFADINEWESILNNAMGTSIVIHNDNLTDNKKINKLYTEFKKEYKVPKSYLDNILSSDTEFKIYNTPEEQLNYITYWTNKSY